MAQITLSKNSQVKKGKYFKDKTGSKNLRKVNIYRWIISFLVEAIELFTFTKKVKQKIIIKLLII